MKHRGPVHASGRRYEKFAAEYVKTGFNGQRAVLNCGFTDKPKSAKIIANRLLTYVVVDELVNKHMEKAQMDADEVLNRLSTIARKDDVKFTGSDVVKASELLGKGHKLFTDRTETVDHTELESRKSFLTDQLQRLRMKHDDDDLGYNASVGQLRALFTDQSDPAYDPLLDYTKHPENWPVMESPAPEATDANN